MITEIYASSSSFYKIDKNSTEKWKSLLKNTSNLSALIMAPEQLNERLGAIIRANKFDPGGL